MVLPVQIYFGDIEMEKNIPVSSELFWATKPKHMEHLKTGSDEWEFYERQKAGLEAWCRVAEARKRMAMAKKTLISCRCL